MSCHSANLITWAKVHICSELQYYLAEFRIAPGPIFPLPMSPDLVLLMASVDCALQGFQTAGRGSVPAHG